VWIHLAAQASQADGIALQTAHQPRVGDDQQQPIDALGFAQVTARQLEDSSWRPLEWCKSPGTPTPA